MSLKNQLRKGLFAILGVIIIFMIMTAMSYRDLDAFVMQRLPRNIELARQYERIANYWHLVGQQAQNLVKDSYKTQDYKDWEAGIEKALLKIGNASLNSDHKDRYKEVKREYTHYIKLFASLERLVQNKRDIQLRNFNKRSNAAKSMRTEIESLIKSFKTMISDLQKSVKSSDFQASLNNEAGSLLDKIKRIESDLLNSEKEVTLYLNTGKSPAGATLSTRKTSSSRVVQRLRAILYLIERSKKETKNPIQKRVLTQIETSVKSFSHSFGNLRNIIEASDSDVTELEDQILSEYSIMEDLALHGITIAGKEAEYFWERIDSVSAEQVKSGRTTYAIIGGFLIIVFLCGIYLIIQAPKAISKPLNDLSKEVANFSLDSEFIDLPDTNITEINSLGTEFGKMAKKLVNQGEINSRNLDYIRKLPKIINKLHGSGIESAWNQDEQKEDAIIEILQNLMHNCPKIDLVKVMVSAQEKDPETNKVVKEYFCRLGDPEFSEKFKNSDEYQEYCLSTGYRGPIGSNEEILPKDEGLSGWFYKENIGLNTSIENIQNKFFQEEVSVQRISDNPILCNRKYECGLNGGLVVELLKVPGQEDEIKTKDYGLLFVYFSNPNVKLSWQEVFFIQIIAGHIAFILETASLLRDHDVKKLMDDQLMVASEIQENLLPKRAPNVKGLKICKSWVPAYEVGGDYYDFFKLDKNRVGIVIADASGKNVTGAMLMTVFKTTLSTMNLAKMSASEVLYKANNIIEGNITSDKFITAMYIIVDSVTGEVELASAGHNPAYIASSYGRDFSLDVKNAKGMPLGILGDYPYNSIKFTLKPKDMLLMYTDGVTEARNLEDEEFGDTGLKKFLQKPRGAKEDSAQKLISMVKEFSGTAKQHDDITVITVELKPS